MKCRLCTRRLNKISFLLLVILSISDSTILFANILSNPKVTTYPDSSEYGGLGDIISVAVVSNSTHINFQVNYAADIPDTDQYLRLGDIFMDVDLNRSTGYNTGRIGADIRLDYDIYGHGGGRAIADIAFWNVTEFRFIETYPIPMVIRSDYLILEVPFYLLGIDNQTIFYFHTAHRTRVIDQIYDECNYTLTGDDNITLDGNYIDWVGIDPVLIDPEEDVDEQSDFTNFFLADNGTFLFHRFDIRGSMPHVTPSDIQLTGELRVLYDTDNNTETGSFLWGVGADYLFLVETKRNNTGEQSRSKGFLVKWIDDDQKWDWPNTQLYNTVFINTTFEYALPLSNDGLSIPDGKFEVVVANFDAEVHDFMPNTARTKNVFVPPYIEIIDIKVSDERADINSIQEVYFHSRFSNGNKVTTGKIFVNGIEYDVNKTGWVTVQVTSQSVRRDDWTVTGAQMLNVVKYNQTVPDPFIIWDQVKINIPQSHRLDVGEDFPLRFAHYLIDNIQFEGEIMLNNSLQNKGIGEYRFKVSSIKDLNYNLTEFDTEEFKLIIDEVNITLSLSDYRLDVGTWPKLRISSHYEYDAMPFEGDINVIEPVHVTSVKDHTYYVQNISDRFGIKGFVNNNVTCVWDRILITEGGISNTESKIGREENVWFKTEYNYDGEMFDPDDGVLYVDWKPCQWDEINQRWETTVSSEYPGIKGYFVTKIEDNIYGLTQFYHLNDELFIDWKKRGFSIPGFSDISIIVGVIMSLVLIKYIIGKR